MIGDRWPSVVELVHDLRDPLATIMLWEQILRATSDPDLRARALDVIRDCARTQAQLLDQLSPKG